MFRLLSIVIFDSVVSFNSTKKDFKEKSKDLQRLNFLRESCLSTCKSDKKIEKLEGKYI